MSIQQSLEDLKDYQRVLDGNKQYVQQKKAADPDYFTRLSQGQQPKYLLIGCSDSRAPPNELTNTQPGEIFIHRNIANCALPTDLSMNCVLQYAVEHLKVKNIIVMGHTFCGGVKAAMGQDSVGGLLDLWLNNIKQTYERNHQIVNSFENDNDRLTSLCCMHVREQVLNIWKNPIVQKSWLNGNPIMVHGWILRVESGLIEEISQDVGIPEQLTNVFHLKFNDVPQQQVEERNKFLQLQEQMVKQFRIQNNKEQKEGEVKNEEPQA